MNEWAEDFALYLSIYQWLFWKKKQKKIKNSIPFDTICGRRIYLFIFNTH
jgi:hypothetical protein